MKKVKTQLAVLIVSLLLISTGNNSSAQEIKIGTQTWTSKNLDVSTFRNGDPIPEAKTDAEWEKAAENGKPMFCYYKYNAANGKKYGKLYNWYAVGDKRGLAPKGWHIPNEKEWRELAGFLGGDDDAGKKLKSTNDWKIDSDQEKSGNGTNESGFNAPPGGYAYPGGSGFGMGRGFNGMGATGYWWSATEYRKQNNAVALTIDHFNDAIKREVQAKRWGFSVRCIKN